MVAFKVMVMTSTAALVALALAVLEELEVRPGDLARYVCRCQRGIVTRLHTKGEWPFCDVCKHEMMPVDILAEMPQSR